MSLWRKTPGRTSPDQQSQEMVFSRLLDQARRGEPGALSVLYRRFLAGVFGYIAARVPDRLTAEDLTSEVFLQMVEGIGHVKAREEARFAAWLLQIARVTVASYYRKGGKTPPSVPLESVSAETELEYGGSATTHPDTDPVQWSEARDEWSMVVQAINALTEEQRQVLIARLILGYDVATVARMVGKKANAVKALQFRALQSLQRLLGQRAVPTEVPSRLWQQWEKIL